MRVRAPADVGMGSGLGPLGLGLGLRVGIGLEVGAGPGEWGESRSWFRACARRRGLVRFGFGSSDPVRRRRPRNGRAAHQNLQLSTIAEYCTCTCTCSMYMYMCIYMCMHVHACAPHAHLTKYTGRGKTAWRAGRRENTNSTNTERGPSGSNCRRRAAERATRESLMPLACSRAACAGVITLVSDGLYKRVYPCISRIQYPW